MTREQLIDKVLAILQADGGTGQSASAEDSALVNAAIPSVIAELEGRRIVTVPDANNIDDAVFLGLATLVAEALLDEFGVAGDVAMKINARARGAEATLRQISSPSYYDPSPVVYY